MRWLLAILYMTPFLGVSQVKNYLFIGHPRIEEERVLPTVEQIDLSYYDMLWLGGDLTLSTSNQESSMQYVDDLFDVSSPNTLWAVGNHDVHNRDRLFDYTGRPIYYALTKNNITFLVLDTEINEYAIDGEQLELIKQVCDTIKQSDYLVDVRLSNHVDAWKSDAVLIWIKWVPVQRLLKTQIFMMKFTLHCSKQGTTAFVLYALHEIERT
ncbi:MAG: hypothetical protein JXQ90_13420 [Cyclobacteriaceae bacterium]